MARAQTHNLGGSAPHSSEISLEDYFGNRTSTRARVIDASARLFCGRGFQVVTMQNIAEAVDLSKAGLYHHCPSKGRILADIVSLAGQILLRQLDDILSGDGTPIEKLRRFVITRMETIVDYQNLFTIVYQEKPYLATESIGGIAKSAETYRAGVRRLIEECKSAGQILEQVDPHILMLAIDGMTGWAHVWFRNDGTQNSTHIGETFWSFLSKGVVMENSPSGSNSDEE